ncbi:hypothetical protein IFT73_08170 [Aeromicrobium sp. CFBP 8757]|uniref:hypothetical protein n=1 Tax=Aeromicrobium sp. CFBP 8757 TaxID=2775288 RepID=UPI001780E7B2|nr:hypothetical protein [Aeromicrobium sp. CFBP 8757]MBD8606828.1 hypothetical protein [Aeromicrobium sp. CFBP 8757]
MRTGGPGRALPWPAWIVEALTASGGSATPLQVSRHVWAHRRAELEESGDLLYVWQLELREAAARMVASGLLSTVDDAWVVADDAAARTLTARPSGWDADDVAVAVAAYVSLLRDRDEGRPLRHREALAQVGERTGRPVSAVESLFANVSAVVQEHGVEPVAAYAPRSNVPRGVRPAVREALSP